MEYKIINLRSAPPEVETVLLTCEQKVAMDIVCELPPDTNLQILFLEVHKRVIGSYNCWRTKAEILVLLNRRRGIDCSYLDFLDDEFGIDDLGSLYEIGKAIEQRSAETKKDFDAFLRKIKIGI